MGLFEQGGDSVNSWLYFVFASFEPVHGGCDCFHCSFFARSFFVLETACVFFLRVVVVFIGICYFLKFFVVEKPIGPLALIIV
jgi:hypothetical protein